MHALRPHRIAVILAESRQPFHSTGGKNDTIGAARGCFNTAALAARAWRSTVQRCRPMRSPPCGRGYRFQETNGGMFSGRRHGGLEFLVDC